MKYSSHSYWVFCNECGRELRAVRIPFTHIFLTAHLGVHENKSKAKKNLVTDLHMNENIQNDKENIK